MIQISGDVIFQNYSPRLIPCEVYEGLKEIGYILDYIIKNYDSFKKNYCVTVNINIRFREIVWFTIFFFYYFGTFVITLRSCSL